VLEIEELREILREEVREGDVLGDSELLLKETRIRAVVRAPR